MGWNSGENVTFTITITNLGPSNATDVNITDVLIDAFKFDGVSANGTFRYSPNDRTVVWYIGNLTNGTSASVCFNVTVIDIGNHTNVASVNCSENTTGVSNKTSVVSTDVDLKINKTVDKNNVTVGDEVTYTIIVTNLGSSTATNVNVTDTITGNVTIINGYPTVGTYDKANNIWYGFDLEKNGTAKLTITVKTLSVGKIENVVVVNSTEIDKNTSNNRYPCENVTVNPAPSFVNGTNVTVYYGEPIDVDVSSINATNVTYVVFDKNNKTVASGNGTLGPNGTIHLTGLPVGNYTVNLTTVVDANHTVAYNQSYIIVKPIPSSVEGEDQNVTYGDPIVVPVTSVNATNVTYQVIDEDGNVIDNGTVQVGESINLTDLNLPAGNYTVNLTANVDGNHIPSNNTCIVTVNPIPSSVEGEDQNVTYGDPIVVPVTSENATNVTYQIIDKEGKVVANGTVKPGENITGLDLPVGTYTVNLTANVPDSNYIPSNNTCTIVVNPAPSVVQGKNITVYVEDPITVPVDSKNATSVIYEIVDKDGKAVVNGTLKPGEDIVLPGLPAGNYTVTLTTVVDSNHTSATNTSTIEVKKILPPVDDVAPTIDVGEEGVITVTVPEDATGTVTIEIEGKTYTEPVKDGKAVFVVHGLKAGLHKIKVYYSGDDKYLPNNTTGTINVLAKDVPPHKKVKPVKTGLAKYETGNPIIALLMVLALLGISIKRRK